MGGDSLVVTLLVQVLPLALGAAVSPLVLILQVMLLGRSPSGLAPSWGFAAGAALVVAAWSAAGLLLGHVLPPRVLGPDPVAAAVHGALALVLLGFGLRRLRRGTRRAAPARGTPGPGRGLLLGLGSMATNLTSLVLFLPALQDVARARPPLAIEAVLVLLVAVITLLPALAPPALVVLCGRRGRLALERLAPWLAEHQAQIQAAVCFGFSAYLLGRAVGEL